MSIKKMNINNVKSIFDSIQSIDKEIESLNGVVNEILECNLPASIAIKFEQKCDVEKQNDDCEHESNVHIFETSHRQVSNLFQMMFGEQSQHKQIDKTFSFEYELSQKSLLLIAGILIEQRNHERFQLSKSLSKYGIKI